MYMFDRTQFIFPHIQLSYIVVIHVDVHVHVNVLFRAANNGRSTDNVRPDRGLDQPNSGLVGHFDRSIFGYKHFLSHTVVALCSIMLE